MGSEDRYWSIDVPGLTEDEAKQLLDAVEEKRLGWFGSGTASDPSVWLTLHVDRASAQMLYKGLMSNPETATPEHGLVGAIGAWLQSTGDAD